jgi:general secretion pathway protein D
MVMTRSTVGVIACVVWTAAVGRVAAQPPSASEQPVLKSEADPTGIDYEPTAAGALVTFNLEDAELPELVRMISQITGRAFIVPNTPRSIKATVYAPTKIKAADAYEAFLSILELNGMTVVPAGRYLKIVESAKIESRPVPLFVDSRAVPARDAYVTRLRRLQFVTAEDAAKLLERFKSSAGGLRVYAPTNLLIMTDTDANLGRMTRMLDELDVAGPRRAAPAR